MSLMFMFVFYWKTRQNVKILKVNEGLMMTKHKYEH